MPEQDQTSSFLKELFATPAGDAEQQQIHERTNDERPATGLFAPNQQTDD
jgi:hypothetical protein